MCRLSQSTSYLVIFLLFCIKPAFAEPERKLDLGLEVGHRTDQLNWNIAASDGNPNVLSELTWRDLFITQIRGTTKLLVDLPSSVFLPYMRGALAYGKIYSGENQDSDYNGNNRTLEFSRSNNSADQGDVLDASFGFGVQFVKKMAQPGQTLRISPLAGYSYHQQNLRMTEGLQTISTQNPANLPRPIPGLNSTYETEWRGPWLGVDFSFETNKKHIFKASFEHHWANYDAEANWNLRSDFQRPKSFTHKSTGKGMVASIGWEFRLRPNWSVNANLDYQRWKTQPGTDTVFLSPEGIQNIFDDTGILLSDGIIHQPLNRVNWESRAVSLGLQYRFQ